MRKISLFIAMSVDGYIADSKGSVNWLEGQGDDSKNVDSYAAFIKDIDIVVMGWRTYHQIVTELSPNEWPYENLTTYIITHNRADSSKRIRFTDANPVELIKKLRTEKGMGVWVCGGANLAQQLIAENLIDYYFITVIPILLGSGIRLFEQGTSEIKLRLLEAKSYNGMTDLIYTRR